MNILCDFHHSDLWWSHHLIFEVALGHKLYRPRGMEWLERGYYNFLNSAVARQFLVDEMFTLSDAVKYPSVKTMLPKTSDSKIRASINTINGCAHYPLIRTLSLDEFASMEIDILMPTVSSNQEPWARLKRDLKPKVKLVREEGNVHGWAYVHPEYQNVLTSDLPTFQRIEVKNKTLYHQRFDTARIFTYTKPTNFNRVTCFMPEFRGDQGLALFADSHDFGEMEFIDYGHHSKYGFLKSKERYAEEVRRTSFVWHVKPRGDGFGHVLHSSMAMGRPIITIPDHYRGSLAWPLLSDGETCIFIGQDVDENSKKIQSMSRPESILKMSRSASDRFKEVVNYKGEEESIRNFLWKLV